MYQTVFVVILTFCLAGLAEVYAQPVIEATEIVRLHEELGGSQPIPIVKSLDFEQQGRILALGGDDHIVRLWDVASRQFVGQLREHHDSVRSVTFAPDATRLATIAQDGQIHFWAVQNSNRSIRRLHTLNEPVRGTRRLVFQPDGARFAVCGFDQNVRIYDSGTYRLVASLPAHATNNEAVAYSHDGTLLAVGGRTGVIRIWRTSDNSHLADISGDGRRVRAIAFSPDDTMLASGSEGPFIMLWEPREGKLLRVFSERPGKTFALTFCGDNVLASGESDNMVRLWNPSTGEQTAILSGHTGTVTSMIFVPSTRELITGGFDASVRFWQIPAE